jgi:terephthalate 1,2-dioxygenase reductase component
MPPSTVHIADTDIVFHCRPGQPVLDAAIQHGVILPYACRKGICALCAGRLMEGEVVAVDTLPFTHAACEPGQVLLCRCTPRPGSRITIVPRRWHRGLAPPGFL